MIIWHITTIKGNINLGDFTDIESAKRTIQGFSDLRFNIVHDKGYLRSIKDFEELRDAANVRVTPMNVH